MKGLIRKIAAWFGKTPEDDNRPDTSKNYLPKPPKDGSGTKPEPTYAKWARFGYHPAPTAWDWYFSQQKPSWVLVTLKNGSQVYGLFGGEKSFAGDRPECRDLYLEETFQILDDGQWAPIEGTGGVLIMADQIATIEFRKVTATQ